MIFRRSVSLEFALWVCLAGAFSAARAADHLDAPLLQVQGQGGRDLNDVYAFQSPTNPANTVLVLTVNPFAGQLNPFGTVSDRTFDPAVEYQFLIDNNNDAMADVTYTTTFTPATPATGLLQTLTASRNGVPIAAGGTFTNLPVVGGGMVHAALFEDPFFFDFFGFRNGLNFTGADAFAGADISAIVLEVPSAQLNGATSNVGVWGRTAVGGVQVDREGRPAINTALIPGPMKNAFNQAVPANDQAAFSSTVRTSLLSLNGGNVAHADQVTALLLPDILTLDTANPAGFLNGRRLQDDVIDTVLGAVSNGALTTDMVAANDVAFQSTFPYLSPANVIPEPSAIVLLVAGLSALGLYARRRRTRR
ncbi:MAG: DUF4331 family protein [Pirellulales bacterium]